MPLDWSEPQWIKPSPLKDGVNHRQSLTVLDKLTRIVISEWIRYGDLEPELVFEAASYARTRKTLKIFEHRQTESESEEVVELAQDYVARVGKGSCAFQTGIERSVALNASVAEILSKDFLDVVDWRSQQPLAGSPEKPIAGSPEQPSAGSPEQPSADKLPNGNTVSCLVKIE